MGALISCEFKANLAWITLFRWPNPEDKKRSFHQLFLLHHLCSTLSHTHTYSFSQPLTSRFIMDAFKKVRVSSSIIIDYAGRIVSLKRPSAQSTRPPRTGQAHFGVLSSPGYLDPAEATDLEDIRCVLLLFAWSTGATSSRAAANKDDVVADSPPALQQSFFPGSQQHGRRLSCLTTLWPWWPSYTSTLTSIAFNGC